MSKLLKNSSIYVLMPFLQKTLSFFLLPLYTTFLTPADYGITGVVASIDTFLSMIFSLSLNSAVTRLYYKHRKEPEYVKKVWGTCVTITWLMVAVVTPLLMIFHRYLIDPFARGIAFYPFLVLGIAGTALNPLYLLFQRSLQARQEAGRFARNAFMHFLLNTLLNILFVAVFRFKAMGMLLANGITGLLFFCGSLIYFLPQVKLGIDKGAARESLAYALPLLPHGFAAKINGTFDRLFMNSVISTATVGLYNVGNALSGVIATMAGSVNQAFSPWFFHKSDEGENLDKKPRDIAYFLVDFYVMLAIGLSLFGREIVVTLTNDAYIGVLAALPIQAFTATFTGIYFVASNSLFLNRTKVVPVITITTAAFNIILNMLLIPRFSLVGAAISGLITQLMQSLVTIVVAGKGEAMHLNPWRVYAVVLFGFLVGSCSWITPSGVLGFLFRLGLFLIVSVCFLLVHWKSVMDLLEKRKIKNSKD